MNIHFYTINKYKLFVLCLINNTIYHYNSIIFIYIIKYKFIYINSNHNSNQIKVALFTFANKYPLILN